MENLMKITKASFAMLTVLLLLITVNLVKAQENQIDLQSEESISRAKLFSHSINTCPGGFIIGIYSLNYEFLSNKIHGMVLRFDVGNISKEVDNNDIGILSTSLTLNYRFHFSETMGSYYIGSYTRIRYYEGKGELNMIDFDFDLSEISLGLNIGKRWVWDCGININAMLGYGIPYSNIEYGANVTSAMIDLVEKFEDGPEFIGPFIAELSVGYSF